MEKTKRIPDFIKKITCLAGVFLVVGGLTLGYKWKVVQASLDLTKSSQEDFSLGRYEFGEIDVGSTSGEIKLQRDLGSWDIGASGDPSDMNLYNYTETDMVKVGRFVYQLRSRVTGQFWRYDLDSREWKEMAFVPNSVYEIADLTTNGTDKIYAFATRYSAGPPALIYKHFLEYDVASDSWSYLPEPPGELKTGASLEYVGGDNGYIYATPGMGYGFWKYSIGSSTWSTLVNSTYYCQSYCDILYDGNQYLYMATDWQSPDRLYRFDVGATSWRYFNLPANGSVQFATNMAMVGDEIFTHRGAGTTQMYVFDTGTTSFSTLTGVIGNTTYGAMVAIPEENRILVNGGITGYWYYYPDSNTWSQPLGSAPSYSSNPGQAMARDESGNLYWCRASSSSLCYKYNLGLGWTQIANTPNTLRTGASLVYQAGRLYAFRGDIANAMYVYNPNTNLWTGGTAPPLTFTTGSAVASIGTSDIYALRGSTTTFYKYTIGGTWSTMPSTPETTGNGAGLVGVGNTLFALQGNIRGGLFKYSIGETAWARMKSLPVGAYYGGGITTDGVDTIYALVGGNTDTYSRRFYKYTISTDTWERIIDTPEMINLGNALSWSNGSVYVLQGNYSYGFWKYTPPSGGGYKTSGSWYSPVYDLEYVTSWGNFFKSVITPVGTGVSFYTRTSDLGNLWDDWTYVNNTDIGSTARRYVQVKAVLNSDGIGTPVINSFSINYNGDGVAPNVVGLGATGYSQAGGSVLSSGVSYPHTNPYFEWSGAVDSETGIEGYYVYFGNNSDADPASLGAYQLNTTYQVGSTMVWGDNYYLRVKVKDKANNISSAKTLFTYTYAGVSPASKIDIGSQEEIEMGSLASVEASSSAWWNTKFLYRRQITVNVGSSAVFKGDMVSVDIGTTDLIASEKMQLDGDDLRIVFWNGVDWVEARRGWENIDTNSTNIYFEAQDKIDSLGSSADYYLYYGNNEAVGPTPLTIFYDNFDDNLINSDLWTTNVGFGVIRETNQQIGFSGRVAVNSGVSTQMRSNTQIEGDFVAEFDMQAINNQGGNFFGGLFFGSYDDATPNNGTGVLVMFHFNGFAYFYSKTAGGAWTNITGTNTLYTKGQWYSFKVRRQGSNWTFYRDGVAMGGLNNLYTGPVSVVTNRYWKESIVGSSQGDLNWDNLYINSKVKAGVSVVLGEETEALGSSTTEIKLVREDSGNWAGNQMATLPRLMASSYSPVVVAEDYLYVLRGQNTRSFYRQNLISGVGETLPDAPAVINPSPLVYGATMVFDGSESIFVTLGGRGTGFYKYNIVSGEWTNSISQPDLGFYYGTTGILVGDSIYYFRGDASSDFMKYEILADRWQVMASSPWTVTFGSGLAYDGADTVWAMFGNSTALAKYTLSTNSWSVGNLTLAPYYIGGGGGGNNLIYDSRGDLYTFTNYNHELDNGKKWYVWKYDISANSWGPVGVETEVTHHIGGVAYDGSRYVYLLQGYGSSGGGVRSVFRFDLVSHKYLPETPSLAIGKDLVNSDGGSYFPSPYTNTSLTSSDGAVFYLQGNGTYFNKYEISQKRWKILPPAPCSYGGGGMVYEAGYVYVTCSGTTKYFFRFDPNLNEWQQMAETPEIINANGGQAMVGDGSGNLYLVRGVGTTVMYKYEVSSNSWTTESDTMPVSVSNSAGTSLTSDGAGNLFLIRGNNTTDFYKYNLTSKVWTRLASVPALVWYSSGSIYDDGKIYAIAGDRTKGFYVYDTENDIWSVSLEMRTETYAGSAITKGPGKTAYALNGDYDWTFSKFNLPSSTTAYKFRGSWTSQAYDLGTPYKVAGLEAQVASPTATAVTFETRTSTDSASWSEWQQATFLKNISGGTYAYNVASEVAKYMQVKVTLESEESAYTPRVSGIKIKYYGDETAPTLTETISAYETATKSAELVDGVWKNKANPLFEWNGANDGTGSGIAGYWVRLAIGDTGEADDGGVFLVGESMVPNLSVDGDYYLSIKAVDNVGNTSPTWLAFNYKYDGTPPLPPSSVAVDPRNYTSLNNFKFFWPTSEDGGTAGAKSGLLDYAFKTGLSSGVYANDIYIVGTQVTGVTAYQDGSNLFYVKARDVAGNESAYKTTTFYYNGSAPSAPTNLSVGVSYNTSNSFSFDWDVPEEYQGSISEYRYSVHIPPSEDNYSSTINSYLNAGPYATIKGDNILYVVAVDEAGNVNYGSYTSVGFHADTAAPGIPRNVESFDNSIRATKQYKMGLTWDAPTSLGTGFAGYAVYVSKTVTSCSDNFDGFTKVGTTGGTTYVVTDIGGTALESATYYACIKAYDSTNQYSAVSDTTSLLPTGKWLTAPSLENEPTVVAKTKSAIVSWTTSRSSSSFVKYGTGSGEYGNEVGSSDQLISRSIQLTELLPGTTYFYKVLWTDEDGNTGTSGEYSFTTNAAPLVSTVNVDDISLFSAYVSFNLSNATKATIQYGETVNYGFLKEISTSRDSSGYSVRLDNLEEGSVYHLRIMAEDEEGNAFYSDDYVFETLPVPKLSDVKLQQVRGSATATVRLVWKSNTDVSSIVTFYPEGRQENTRDQVTVALIKNHQMIISDLADNMDYVFVVKGKDIVGNWAENVVLKIKTAIDLRPPLISNLRTEAVVNGVGDLAKASIMVSWDTDEPATSQIEYGKGTGNDYPSKTQEDGRLTSNHSVVIPDLTPSEVYHLRVVSKDKMENRSESYDVVVVTPKATKSALNLVIENLSKSFGFFSNLSRLDQ